MNNSIKPRASSGIMKTFHRCLGLIDEGSFLIFLCLLNLNLEDNGKIHIYSSWDHLSHWLFLFSCSNSHI